MVHLGGSHRPHAWRQWRSAAAWCVALAAIVAGPGAFNSPAFSQTVSSDALSPVSPQVLLHFPRRPLQPKPPATSPDAPMLVQADQIKYDYPNNSVAAVGNVQIYFRGSTIEADQVIYDQKAKRLIAEGNARLTEQDGHITYGQVINLTDDYRDGFVDSLRVESVDDTRFAAERADRSQGNFTVLQNGVYTACEPCKDDPNKPPLWQVQAARIIHDEGEKMLYFEDATIDFFGVPMAYFPFMSTPDPTVKRKSGFLYPTPSYSKALGYSLETPYYFALAPDYDLTIYPRYMTQQGFLMEGEWNQRLTNGSYSIHAAGIFQQDPSYFASEYGAGTEATKDFRGSVLTTGQFDLTDRWVWGWTGVLVSDPTFISDYGLGRFNGANLDPFRTGTSETSEGVSQLYLVGRGTTSYFDIRSIYYTGYSEIDQQSSGCQIIHPILDYSAVLPEQILGGELSYNVNLTSLSRQQASYDAINTTAANTICVNGAAVTARPGITLQSQLSVTRHPGGLHARVGSI